MAMYAYTMKWHSMCEPWYIPTTCLLPNPHSSSGYEGANHSNGLHNKLMTELIVNLVPRPCAFVACSTKFAQRAWARSSRDVCHSRIFTSADNDVCHVAYIHVQWSFKLKQVKRVRYTIVVNSR